MLLPKLGHDFGGVLVGVNLDLFSMFSVQLNLQNTDGLLFVGIVELGRGPLVFLLIWSLKQLGWWWSLLSEAWVVFRVLFWLRLGSWLRSRHRGWHFSSVRSWSWSWVSLSWFLSGLPYGEHILARWSVVFVCFWLKSEFILLSIELDISWVSILSSTPVRLVSKWLVTK